ncbi:MAG: tRNA (guanosine(46)-N7)-methyltransferase TrmB [Planctomycetota bacterium]|nr:tRNA (guanosine(46)-N7)-methyltransferase TrmB [Planctomycetota bacterium]
MGRRALPKVNPAIDTSKHLYVLEDLHPPFQPATFFPSPESPLVIEIGSGKGLFLNTAAGHHPNQNFVGIEIAKRYAHFAGSRLAKKQLDNAIMISGDGLAFMSDFVDDQSCAAIHVYFPDPWWKERHRKRRVMKTSLIKDIERTLLPNGELHFWTDVQEYYETTLELISKVSKLIGPHEVIPNSPEHDLDYRTHFERRMRLHQKPVYRSLFLKKNSAAIEQ